MSDRVGQDLSGYRNINQTGSYGRQRRVLLPVGLSQFVFRKNIPDVVCLLYMHCFLPMCFRHVHCFFRLYFAHDICLARVKPIYPGYSLSIFSGSFLNRILNASYKAMAANGLSGWPRWPRLNVRLASPLVLHQAPVEAAGFNCFCLLPHICRPQQTCIMQHILLTMSCFWGTHPRCQKWSQHVLTPSQWLRLPSLPLVPLLSLLRIAVHDSFDLIWHLWTG